jgi:hypothetical protein
LTEGDLLEVTEVAAVEFLVSEGPDDDVVDDVSLFVL